MDKALTEKMKELVAELVGAKHVWYEAGMNALLQDAIERREADHAIDALVQNSVKRLEAEEAKSK